MWVLRARAVSRTDPARPRDSSAPTPIELAPLFCPLFERTPFLFATTFFLRRRERSFWFSSLFNSVPTATDFEWAPSLPSPSLSNCHSSGHPLSSPE